jgi:hypothetical protein
LTSGETNPYAKIGISIRKPWSIPQDNCSCNLGRRFTALEEELKHLTEELNQIKEELQKPKPFNFGSSVAPKADVGGRLF